jgi:hypothetical protein
VTSDYFKKGKEGILIEWTSLRNGLLITPCVAALGGVAFLIASIFIVQDRGKAEVATLCTYLLFSVVLIDTHLFFIAIEASDNFGMAEKTKN